MTEQKKIFVKYLRDEFPQLGSLQVTRKVLAAGLIRYFFQFESGNTSRVKVEAKVKSYIKKNHKQIEFESTKGSTVRKSGYARRFRVITIILSEPVVTTF